MNSVELNEFQDNLMSIQDKLYNYGITLTNSREEAKDLLQETTLRALENKEKFVNKDNFKGWAYTIMRNIFINNYRKAVHNQTFIDQTENLYYLNIPQDSGIDTPEGSYSIKEITEVINKLHDDFKMPFTMYVTGYKYQEIADKLELPIGTVKSRIHFTRQRLQESLRDYK